MKFRLEKDTLKCSICTDDTQREFGENLYNILNNIDGQKKVIDFVLKKALEETDFQIDDNQPLSALIISISKHKAVIEVKKFTCNGSNCEDSISDFENELEFIDDDFEIEDNDINEEIQNKFTENKTPKTTTFSFKTLNDVITFCKSAKLLDVKVESQVYKYKSNYYLATTADKETTDKITLLVSDFTNLSLKSYDVKYLEEHGESIVKNNALVVLKNF